MARFLFTVWPFPGHIHPNVAIAQALRARGHDARFYTAASLAAGLEADGLGCFPFRRVPAERVEATAYRIDALSLHWWHAGQCAALLRAWLLGTVAAQLDDLAGVLAVWRPDVVVCDPAMWGPLLVLAEQQRIPLAVMSYVAACMLPGVDGPIIGLPLPRPRSFVGRANRRLLRGVANVASAGMRRAANRIRARHHLPPLQTTVTEFAGQMPLYLVPSTPQFDRQRRDLPPAVRYVGPCQWDKPCGEPPPAWLAELSTDRAIIYVTEGTSHSKPPLLLRAALWGLAALDVQVIATTGRRRDPAKLDLGPIPPNARVEQFVPHSDLLPRTDVVVTTGGTGTVLAALAAGVPLVVVPTAWDQPENAWRVAEAGAGIRLPPRQCSPDRVRAAVARVLSEPSFRLNATRLAVDFAGYGGPAQAADLLEALLSQRNQPSHRMATAPSAAVGAGTLVPAGTARAAPLQELGIAGVAR